MLKLPQSTALALGLGLASLAPQGAMAGTPMLPANVVARKTLTVCSAVSLPPMEFFSKDQKPQGVDIDLANALASRLNLKTKIINSPFAGLIPALLAHNCDVIMSQLFIKAPRLKVIDEIPYMYSQEGFILKAGKPKLKSPEDLSGMKAASVTGTTATDLMKAANVKLAAAGKPPINIVLFPDNTPALQQVQFGRVQAYGVAYETALYYAALQPSQSLELPSSQDSVPQMKPSPQPVSSAEQSPRQPSQSLLLPSSQASPVSTMASPQRGAVQSLRQESPGLEFPSSHSSPAVVTPLPQVVDVQLESQPSPSIKLPSSQVSGSVTMPLPQAVRVQLESQPSPLTMLPSSHSSPAVAMPLPHTVTVQLESDPSPSARFPSSHSSLASTVPSPHSSQGAPSAGQS